MAEQTETPQDGDGAPEKATARRALPFMAFASLGVVFGDIGTSPLYALRESLLSVGTPSEGDIIGIVSLLIWSLFLVVTVKYVLILLRADNAGEGGTLSLMALAQGGREGGAGRGLIFLFGIVGAGLFFGDAMLTPAISVVSAVEGLEVVWPNVSHAVLPITVAIIVALFVVQSRGTGRIGAVFAPIMLLWFLILTGLGLHHVVEAPRILMALSPVEAIGFLMTHGLIGFLTLGTVFLAVTGAEALYADMGHFGRAPIRVAWLFAALPALVLNYLGQGAHALRQPHEIGTLFFSAVPDWAQLPMVILATLATVIASQAVISGTFSMAWQAMRLGLLPRLRVLHTSSHQRGQVYIPRVNWMMLAGVLFLLLIFRGSTGLAGAYGIAVSGTMIITTLMAIHVFAHVWGWGMARTLLLLGPLLVVDAAFVLANLAKIGSGGYVPLLIAAAVIVSIWTWLRGTGVLVERLRSESVMLADFMASLADTQPVRVDGTALFLTATPEFAPAPLVANLRFNRVLHSDNVIVTVRTAQHPRVDDESRVIVAAMSDDFTAVEMTFGFMETADVVGALETAVRQGKLTFDAGDATYFIGRRVLHADADTRLGRLMKRWYIAMTRISDQTSERFEIPADRAVEFGVPIVL